MASKNVCNRGILKSKVKQNMEGSSLSAIKRRNEEAANNKFRKHWKKIFMESCEDVGEKIRTFRSIFPPKRIITDKLLTKVIDHV